MPVVHKWKGIKGHTAKSLLHLPQTPGSLHRAHQRYQFLVCKLLLHRLVLKQSKSYSSDLLFHY